MFDDNTTIESAAVKTFNPNEKKSLALQGLELSQIQIYMNVKQLAVA